MARNDTQEFLAALAAGTLLGIGAALLLRPAPRSARERLVRELRPYRRHLQHSAQEARRALAATAHRAEALAHGSDALAGDAIDVGRELLAEFREEVRRVIEEARGELAAVAAAPARRSARDELERRLGERRLGAERRDADEGRGDADRDD